MSFDRSSLRVEEYRALRATVRERGTTRLIVSAITFVSWATLAVVVYAVSAIPLIAVFPLFVLVAGFEVVFATHVLAGAVNNRNRACAAYLSFKG